MKRREFVLLIAGGLTCVHSTNLARAQGKGLPRIGVLLPYNADDSDGQARLKALLSGLKSLGWAEDKNVRVDVQWASDQAARMEKSVNDLVASAPDVVVVNSNLSLTLLQRTKTTLATVFIGVSDPVGSGYVKSLSQPGGNVTGFTNFEPDIGGKWVQTLKELLPGLQHVLMLVHPRIPANAAMASSAEAGGSTSGIMVSRAEVGSAEEIRSAVTKMGSGQGKAVIVAPNPINIVQHELIIGLAAEQRLPAIYPYRLFVANGGLMSYGIDQIDTFRRAAPYIDRILKGGKPSELPIQQPTRYIFTVNLQTAKKLSIEIPATLLARADEVIE